MNKAAPSLKIPYTGTEISMCYVQNVSKDVLILICQNLFSSIILPLHRDEISGMTKIVAFI